MSTALKRNRGIESILRATGRHRAWVLLIATTWGALACEEKGATMERPSPVAAPSAQTQEMEKAAQEKAALEAARLAEEAKAAALDQEEKTKACCVALAKKGFEGRNMAYMNASRACTKGQEEKQAVSDLRAVLEKELGDEPLPEQCR